jgi:SAM-dependent methyltransferase
MTDDQRQAVRDTAKYLRQVRPIDPEEIFEYVEGRPHPAVVRQILREAAVDLGLVEREDGTFVPVAAEPVSVDFDGVEALPARWADCLEDALVESLGPEWHAGETGTRLRERLRAVKDRYFTGSSVTYDELTALAYAVYHLPQAYATAQYVLADLARDGEIPHNLRVLDVGAGVGGPALGLVDLLPAEVVVDYHAVEPSAAADLLSDFLDETGPNVHTTVHREPIEAADPEGPFDLVLCANVLSELADPGAVVVELLDVLAPHGTLVGIAPADRETAIGLRRVERHAEREAGATVYAPTVRLWPGETPAGECWSFDRKPDLAVPAVQTRLDEAGAGDGEFVNADVQYAYSLLRRDGATRIDYRPSRERVAPMGTMDDHVTDRIDCVGVKLSHDLSGDESPRDGGRNPVFLVGDGSEAVDHFLVRAGPSGLNRDLVEADYGDLLSVENVLVLWNDDEAAYNLVVEAETVVERVPPRG